MHASLLLYTTSTQHTVPSARFHGCTHSSYSLCKGWIGYIVISIPQRCSLFPRTAYLAKAHSKSRNLWCWCCSQNKKQPRTSGLRMHPWALPHYHKSSGTLCKRRKSSKRLPNTAVHTFLGSLWLDQWLLVQPKAQHMEERPQSPQPSRAHLPRSTWGSRHPVKGWAGMMSKEGSLISHLC